MPHKWTENPNRFLSAAAIGLLAAVFILLAALSLRWPVMNDLPLNLYNGFLMSEFSYIPYHDFFDINAPGTHFAYYAVHLISDGADLPIRIIDLSLLIALSACTFILLRPFGRISAVVPPLVFAIMYLSMGPEQSLQREYVTLLPLALSLVVAFRMPRISGFWRSFLIGLLFGVIASIKPLLAVYLPFLLVFASLRRTAPNEPVVSALRGAWRLLLGAGAGFACIAALFLIYFGVHGTLKPFFEMVGQYWPMYNTLDEAGYTHGRFPILAWLRWAKMFPYVTAIPFFSLIVLGAFALPYETMDRERKIEIGSFLAMVLCFFLYIPLSNKFWLYHWIPLYYSLSLFTGFPLQSDGTKAVKKRVLLMVTAIILLTIPFRFLVDDTARWKSHQSFPVSEGDVDEIQQFLESHASRGDAVLPLDMVGGAIHAMYRSRVKLAGRFNADYYFYHHTDRPIIQKLRGELIRTLSENPPRFIVFFHESWRPIGPFSNRSFPELEAILNAKYETIHTSKNFVILGPKSGQTLPRAAVH